LLCHRGGGGCGHGWCRGDGCGFVDKDNPPELHLVAEGGVGVGDLGSVDEGAVCGAEIFDPELSAGLRDNAVMARDALVNELDVAIVAATDSPRLFRQIERSLQISTVPEPPLVYAITSGMPTEVFRPRTLTRRSSGRLTVGGYLAPSRPSITSHYGF
jgi:hypothetical protein